MTTVTPSTPDGGVELMEPVEADGGGSTPPAAPVSAPRRGFLFRFVRGREQDAAWIRPALLTLLVLTAVLYLWDLGASGWGNSFYAAAVQAGTKSWKAFFFGSSDSSNFITVDKPPASLWVMELSGRIFGFNSWSMLAPQALEGVATVGLVYLTVRRWFSAQAALLAGVVMALTPVAALMFRFNNPDALLALLLTGATYATVRSLEKARTILAGPGRRPGGLRLHHQDDAGLPDPARHGHRLPARGADLVGGGGCGRSSCWVPPRWWPRGGGWRRWR